jgi:hypothetical protein
MGCFKGFGAGVQTSGFGASFGGGKVDENCEILEVARSFGVSGSWDAYCQVMVTNKYAKKAGVTFEQCMKRVTEAPAPVAVAPPPPQPAPAPQIIYVEPPAAPTLPPVEVRLFDPPAAPAPKAATPRKKKPAVPNCPAVK